MSVLRDIRNEDALKAFSHSLLGRLRADPQLTLQKLQNHIAVALGARDLNAYLALSRTSAATPKAVKPSFETYWEKAKATWSVIVIEDLQGTLRFLHGGIFGDKAASRELPVVSTVEEAEALPAEAGRYFAPVLGSLVIVDGERSAEINAMKLSAVNDGAKICLLNDIFPEFFTFVMAGEDEMESVLFNPQKPLVYLACQLGMTQEAWYQERDQGDTALSYSAWVSHQVESWLDDVTAHLS